MTRPIVRRRQRALFDLCAGFVYSQILLACVRLGLFDILGEEPQSVAALSRRLSLPAASTERLLRAAASLGLAARRGADHFGLGTLGAVLVGNDAVAGMVEHHRMLYADLRDPVALLRNPDKATELGGFWPYAGLDDPGRLTRDQICAYTQLMAASVPLVAAGVFDAYRFGDHRCLLDVGGGDGAFLAAVGSRVLDLRLILFDLPEVAERARARFAAAGLSDRATATGGDFFCEPLPTGADIVSLLRVIHDHDDDAALALLRSVRQALPADGTVLIAEPMSGTPGAEPVGEAYFGFYLLAMGSGRPRTPREIKSLLREAGFGKLRLLRTKSPLLTRLITAHPVC